MPCPSLPRKPLQRFPANFQITFFFAIVGSEMGVCIEARGSVRAGQRQPWGKGLRER